MNHVEETIQHFFNEKNTKMNSLFIIVNSKNKNKTNEKFESEKLVNSLISTGIPLIYAIKILDIVTIKILESHENDILETSEIREIVRNSLYSLSSFDSNIIDQKQCQIWGDVYLRKYGNPDGPIEIIHINGEFEKLNYEILHKEIIPEVLAEIKGTEKSEISKFINANEIKGMGNELMRVITELGIYKITHRALLLLTKEIATQPPHPWVLDPNNSYDYINSDMKKSTEHLDLARIHYNSKNYSYCRNEISECLHHISSAILGYYGEFYGCEHLSTFYNLINKVKNLQSKDSHLVNESKIRYLKDDIHFCNLTLRDFSDLLKKLNRCWHAIYRDEILTEMLPLLEKYHSICETLISGRNLLKDELDKAINEKKNLKGKAFESVVKKILELSNCFTVTNKVKRGFKEFDLVIEHNCNRDTFSEIKKYIYVECKNTRKKTSAEVIEKLGKRIEETSDRICNTGIVISSKGFSTEAKNEAIKYFDRGTLIILLKKFDLYEIIENDIMNELETKINLMFYGRLE